jgi:hypothetical protein
VSTPIHASSWLSEPDGVGGEDGVDGRIVVGGGQS